MFLAALLIAFNVVGVKLGLLSILCLINVLTFYEMAFRLSPLILGRKFGSAMIFFTFSQSVFSSKSTATHSIVNLTN